MVAVLVLVRVLYVVVARGLARLLGLVVLFSLARMVSSDDVAMSATRTLSALDEAKQALRRSAFSPPVI